MQQTFIDQCRKKLGELQQQLQERSARTAQHLYRREEPYSADFAEQAVELANDEVVQKLDAEATGKLAQIQQALERIENNTYGICSSCGAEIAEQRLRSIPYTPVCIACADQAT